MQKKQWLHFLCAIPGLFLCSYFLPIWTVHGVKMRCLSCDSITMKLSMIFMLTVSLLLIVTGILEPSANTRSYRIFKRAVYTSVVIAVPVFLCMTYLFVVFLFGNTLTAVVG